MIGGSCSSFEDFAVISFKSSRTNSKVLSVKREKKSTKRNYQMFIINFCLDMFRAPLCPSSGEQRPCYCMWCTALVLLDVVGSGCGGAAL